MSTAGGKVCGTVKECNSEKTVKFLTGILKKCIRSRILSIKRDLHDVEGMDLVLIYSLYHKLKKQSKACITTIKYVIILIDRHTNENHHVGYKSSVWMSLL